MLLSDYRVLERDSLSLFRMLEPDPGDLLDCLNESEENDSRKRIIELLETFRTTQTVARGGDGVALVPMADGTYRRVLAREDGRRYLADANQRLVKEVISREQSQCFRKLNRLLARYRATPFCVGAIETAWMIRFFPMNLRSSAKLAWGKKLESRAAFALISLAREGLLDRVVRCVCGKWLFGRSSSQTFCSSRCRSKHFKSSEQWKAHRRAYMRQYYRLKQSGKVK